MNTITGGYNSVTHGESALQSARLINEDSMFGTLLRKMSESQRSTTAQETERDANVAQSMAFRSGRLNGDYGTGFANSSEAADAAHSRPIGAAANQAHPTARQGVINRTDKLYEASLELESYLVKMMLSSLRKTVIRADGDGSFARTMYEDMLYDEYATSMTKNAGFGIADQLYLQLSGQTGSDANTILGEA